MTCGIATSPIQRSFCLDRDVTWLGSRLSKHLGHAAIAIERARQKVNRLDLRMLSLVCETLRASDERFRVRSVLLEMDGLLGHWGSRW